MTSGKSLYGIIALTFLIPSFLPVPIAAPLHAQTTVMTREAVNHLEQGRSYHIRGDYRRAVREYDEFIRLVPGKADTHYRRGDAYQNLGDLNRAIQDYDKAIALNPKYVEAYNHRGTAYLELGDFSKAILDFDRAISARPDFAEAYNNRGAAYAKMGDMNNALKDFFNAIARKPDFAEAYYNRGTTNHQLGSLNQAIADFNRAVDLNPNYALAYYSRSIVHGKLGNKLQEKEDLDRAIDLDPNLSEFYYVKGTAYRKADNSKAMRDHERAMQGRPVSGDALSADLVRREQEATRALAETRKRADELSRENERLQGELRAAAAARKIEADMARPAPAMVKPEPLVPVLRSEQEPARPMEAPPMGPAPQAMESKPETAVKPEWPPGPKSPEPAGQPAAAADDAAKNFTAIDWFRKGYSAAIVGNFEEAIGSYDRAIEKNPDFMEAYYVRGVAYNNLADPNRAMQDLDKAIAMDGGFAGAHYHRGLALSKLGSPDEALESQKRAAKLGFKAAQEMLSRQGISW